ncbi:Exoglucanase-2 precursor [compost metagenome]
MRNEAVRPLAEGRFFGYGTTDVELGQLKLRYYYTIDGEKVQQFNVLGSFVKRVSASAGADYYVEISFSPAAGSLAPGAPVFEWHAGMGAPALTQREV